MRLIIALSLLFTSSNLLVNNLLSEEKALCSSAAVRLSLVKIPCKLDPNSGFGDCGFRFGQKKKITLKEKRVFVKGEKLKLTYFIYSGMSPNGAVSSKTWSLRK
jgi:hypothetical protein